MTQLKHSEIGQHHNTHPVYHLQHLITTTPLHTTRPEPYRTHQHLARAERSTPARTTIAQRARTQRPYPKHIPNRYDRHFQRDFDPDAAFQHLCQHTLHDAPAHQPYCVALDGAIVPRTGAYIPGAHWTPNPANAPFARGLRNAQRFVMAGWLDAERAIARGAHHHTPVGGNRVSLTRAAQRAQPDERLRPAHSTRQQAHNRYAKRSTYTDRRARVHKNSS